MNLITIDMDALARAIYSNTDASEQEARSIINTVGFAAPAPASEAVAECSICKGDPAACDSYDCGDAHRAAAIAADNVDAPVQQAGEAVATDALRSVLRVVQAYLPPDGITASEAMCQITGVVDPWPLKTEQPAAPEPDDTPPETGEGDARG